MARIGMVGCGHWGANLLRNFHALGVLAALSDANPAQAERLSAEYGVPARAFEELLADDAIDAVALATPAEMHAGMAIAAMRAGKDCYVEKPLAMNEAEGRAMLAVAEETGRVLMIGHLLQYHPAFIALRGLVEGGELGNLVHVTSHRLSTGIVRTEENALWSFAPHDFSMILSLFGGEPDTVSATGGGYITPGIEDWARVDMRFGQGGSAHVHASWAHPFKEHRLTVVGDRAMAVFEDSAAGDKLRLYRHTLDRSGARPRLVKAEAEVVDYPASEPLRAECQHFIDCIASRAEPRTGGREALGVLKTLERATAAMAHGSGQQAERADGHFLLA